MRDREMALCCVNHVGYALQDGHTFRPQIEEVCVPHEPGFIGIPTTRPSCLKTFKSLGPSPGPNKNQKPKKREF